MDERLKNEIVTRFLRGASKRAIARTLRCSRHTVDLVLAAYEQARLIGSSPDPALPRRSRRRASKLDRHEDTIAALLKRYPDIKATRLLEELQRAGFDGGYTIVRERLNALRPKRKRSLVTRFETGPGLQAQMDYSPYTIDFVSEGKRTVHAFSYILSYSRRQYVRFVERQDFETTIREHIRAFHHLGGAAHVCLYDNFKVVVDRWEEDEPIYNTRFLAFATHYGFRPWACRPKRPQTKGKVERPFRYLAENLLNARSFHSLDHLNEVAAWWLNEHADTRHIDAMGQSPLERHREEVSFLRPLPQSDYVTGKVVYRVVDLEGFIQWDNNFYPVPDTLAGESVVVRITENEVIVYGTDLEPCVHHPLFAAGSERQRVAPGDLHRSSSGSDVLETLRKRFRSFGECGEVFLQGVLRTHRYGRKEAAKVLGLLDTYRLADLRKAIEHATRYHAFRAAQVTRILAAQAVPQEPRPDLLSPSSPTVRRALDTERVEARPTAAYQELLDQGEPLEDHHDTPPQDIERS